MGEGVGADGTTNNGGTTGGTTDGNWFDSLPDDVKTDENLPTFQKFKDVGGLAKSYIEAQKMISRKGVIIPTEKSTPDELSRFRHDMGIPEKSDMYGLKKPDNLPTGLSYNEARTKAFTEIAHNLHIPKATAEKLHDWFNQSTAEEYNASVKAANDFRESTTAELKKKWGNDFETNLKKADEIIEPVFGKDFADMLRETGMNNHPAMIEGLLKISDSIGEHSFVKGQQTAPSKGDLSSLKVKLQEVITHPGYANPSLRPAGRDLNKEALSIAGQIAEFNDKLHGGAA